MVAFTVRDAAWPVCAFFALAALARPQWLRRACALLGMICAGTLTEAWHRPGTPPEIDAGWKETVLLDGCVVEPTVLSPGREQFTLELEPYVLFGRALENSLEIMGPKSASCDSPPAT